MSFISYAQNFEDVMLWRALKHVESGFYIDVGAHDPVHLSVTRAFYDKGWHGINIEPVSGHFANIARERTRDINLLTCAGETSGTVEFYDIPYSALATFDREIAEMHRQSGREVRATTAPVRPLAEICTEYAKGEIHFLKIDVEGAEKSVLLGMDFQRWRPWIVLVEATTPTTLDPSYQTWEPLLLDARYEFVYFDGLNRFYVAAEHPELKPSFSYPHGFFDDYVNHTHASALEEARTWAHELGARVHDAEERVQRMKSSFSWRCTYPLRWLRRLREKITRGKSG